MKQIKIYLQYPWKFPDSPYYKYLLQEHPKEIKYLNAEKQKGVITSKSKFLFSNKLKKIIRFSTKILYPSMLNAHLSPKGDYDIIHCAHCLSGNKDKPWVCDLEFATQIWVSLGKPKNISKAKKILLRENCKKIIAWTEKTRDELLNIFPEVKEKIEVIYPIMPKLNIEKKKHKGINLFFVSRYFYQKGGGTALEVMNELTKKYDNVNAIIVSEIPPEVKSKYLDNKKIKFYPLMPQQKLFEKVYSVGDIFIYPGYSDSFGFAIPEVMSLGIPVISVNISTRNEIISDGKNGFLVNTNLEQFDLVKTTKNINSEESKRIIRDMIKSTSRLIEDRKLYTSFSNSAKNEIYEGKFSVEKIRDKIRKAYEEALR